MLQVIKSNGGSLVDSERFYYAHSDHLNTPKHLTDDQRTVVWKWEGGAFGRGQETIDPDGDGKKRFSLCFPGQYYDVETDLNYNYYRDYDSKIGRYLQSDPIGLQGGLNTYAYVGGNPLSFTDPLGLCPAGGIICVGGPIAIGTIGKAIIDSTAVGIALCSMGVLCKESTDEADSDESAPSECLYPDTPDLWSGQFRTANKSWWRYNC